MHPTLLELLGYKFHAWPAMLSIAFLTCTLLTVRDLRRHDPPIDASAQGGLWGFLGALFGAKVYWILQYSEPKYLWHAFYVWEGGLVFYGGLIGGFIALSIYLRVQKLPYLAVIDTAGPYLALGEAITRIGCFLNGCCWGKPTSVPWAVCFPRGSHPYNQQVELHQIDVSATASLPVHPTQLYMTLGLLVVALALKRHLHREHRAGTGALLYGVLYGVLRFAVESFRADSARPVLGMTVSQAVSAGLVVLPALVLLVMWMQSGTQGVNAVRDSAERPGNPG